MHTSLLGRPRTLDRNKKTLLCDAVSRGASMTEAALTVGVSLRTVQREARLDPDFDHQLRQAHTDKPDPLAIMQSAARTHWRAAAWLLERTKPEDYGRRPASSCSPYQFEEALKVVIDAALRLAPPENHARVYAELTAASETAFKAVFPNYGPYGRHLVKRLPDTPLADAQRLEVLRNPPPDRIVPDPFEPTAHLQPRALPGGRPALREAVTTGEETPGQRPGLKISEQVECVAAAAAPPHDEIQRRIPAQQQPDPTFLSEPSPTPTASSASSACAPPPLAPAPDQPPTDPHPTDVHPANNESTLAPSAPAGRRNVARGASPWTQHPTKSKPQRGDVTPASRPSKTRNRSGRALRPIASRTAPTFHKGRRILTPKTRFASKLSAAHLNAAVSRDAVAERVAPTHSAPPLNAVE
ncbi:MAG: hypothetical protein H0T51_20385 [Pirellulales bacterium]|nr:hypothetical protein [Pirellulales bacterium]